MVIGNSHVYLIDRPLIQPMAALAEDSVPPGTHVHLDAIPGA